MNSSQEQIRLLPSGFQLLESQFMKTNFAVRLTCVLSFAALSLAISPAIAATSWEAAADFSSAASSGVAGVWSYGSTGASLSGAFAAFDTYTDYSGYTAWSYGDRSVQIGKAGAVDFPSGSVLVPANTLNVSPGPSGQYAVLRFTAITAGTYSINAGFYGNDFAGPTTTDVHVLAGGVSVYDGAIQSYGATNGSTWSNTLALTAGETVDFAVGFGANRTWNNDNTGLSASISQISAVPEPTSIAMMAVGLCLIGFMARKKAS